MTGNITDKDKNGESLLEKQDSRGSRPFGEKNGVYSQFYAKMMRIIKKL